MTKTNLIYVALIVLGLIHQDFWLWDDATLLFGFLPAGLAYHAFYSLLAALVWYLASEVRLARRHRSLCRRGFRSTRNGSQMTQLLIMAAYLGLLLVLGAVAHRFFSGTAKDYFLASHSIGPVFLLMSIFGTTMTAFALVGSTGRGLPRRHRRLRHAGVMVGTNARRGFLLRGDPSLEYREEPRIRDSGAVFS